MVKQIPLGNGRVSLVDDDIFAELNAFTWRVSRTKLKHYPDKFHAIRDIWTSRSNGNKRTSTRIWLHHSVMGNTEMVDHIDGDGLNNQRVNLRPTDNSLNQANRILLNPVKTSQFRGVCFNKFASKWRAHVYRWGKQYYLGSFDREEDAAISYDSAALTLFGEHARLNFPDRISEHDNATQPELAS